jgi:hypothetical protein
MTTATHAKSRNSKAGRFALPPTESASGVLDSLPFDLTEIVATCPVMDEAARAKVLHRAWPHRFGMGGQLISPFGWQVE